MLPSSSDRAHCRCPFHQPKPSTHLNSSVPENHAGVVVSLLEMNLDLIEIFRVEILDARCALQERFD
jgi:hypothetical protein